MKKRKAGKMQSIFFILAIFAIGVGNAAAERLTYHFSPDSINFEKGSFIFDYPGLTSMTVNDKLVLPTKIIYLQTESDLDHDDFVVNASDRLVLDSVPHDLAIFDNSITGFLGTAPERLNSLHRLNSVVYDIQKITVDGRTCHIVTLLPITINDSNILVFNREISLDLNSAPVEEIAPRQIMSGLKAERNMGNNMSAKALDEINGLPLGEKYVIITSEVLSEPFQRLSEFRTAAGIGAAVALIDTICTYYSGVDIPEQIRNYLIDFYAMGGQYALLGGDNTIVPARYVYYYNTGAPPSNSYYLMPSDLYYADLSGDWNSDGDAVWGEPTDDAPDIVPELIVGRLPLRTVTAAENYIDKLIIYLTRPGGRDFDYLTRSLFFSSDQMRDYPASGQHGVIAAELPEHIYVDTNYAVEALSGDDPQPTNAIGSDCIGKISEGFGLIHIIAHGRTDGFIVRSANYADWPKSYILTGAGTNGHGSVSDLGKNQKSSLYYSLSCNVGGYDLDQADGTDGDWSLVERLIAADSCGAVGMVANSRWGWVYSSYYLQKSFTKNLYGVAEGSPPLAMYQSWLEYPYYRDLIYGQNYFGDPALKIYSDIPTELEISMSEENNKTVIHVTGGTEPMAEALITISLEGVVFENGLTDEFGQYTVISYLYGEQKYIITAVREGCTIAQESYLPSMILAVDDNDELLPRRFHLKQNYPNPFNPTTGIRYSLPERTDVTVEIINILGQLVKQFQLPSQSAGEHVIRWDGSDMSGRNVPSGVYLYRLTAGEFRQSRKMVLMK